MKKWGLRSLVLVCSLTVALPGWCCFVPIPKADENAQAPKKKTESCCDLCQCKDGQKPSADTRPESSQTPSPKPPQPVPASRCCCYEPDWLKPNPPEKLAADFSVALVFLPVDCLPTCGVLLHSLDVSLPAAGPPLNVLKC